MRKTPRRDDVVSPEFRDKWEAIHHERDSTPRICLLGGHRGIGGSAAALPGRKRVEPDHGRVTADCAHLVAVAKDPISGLELPGEFIERFEAGESRRGVS